MRRELFIRLLLAAAAVLVYGQVADFDFTNLDDGPIVYDNPNVSGGLTFHGVRWALTTTYFDFWHPLTWISHMLDCALFGLDPGSHHLVNLGFHVANTLLLFGVLRQMTGAWKRSAMVAALFALHPLHVESVAWVSERKDVLSTFFWMLTLGAYVGYVEKSKVQSPKSKVFYGLALVFFALGLMSKAMVVTLPFVLLLLDYWPLQRVSSFKFSVSSPGPTPSLRHSITPLLRLLLEKLPFFGLTIVACVITCLGADRSGQNVLSAEHVPWGLRLANVPVAYVRYLGKLFWPVDLAVLYPWPSHWEPWQVGGSLALLLLISLFALALARRLPGLLFGWLMFLGTLVPVIGLFPNGFQSMADHYTYIPSIGLFVAGVWAVAEFSVRWKYRAVLLRVAAVLTLLVCGSLTWIQTGYWRNSVTLWTHCVAVTRDNALAHINLGFALQRDGQNDEAMDQYREVLRLNPDDASANLNLGVGLAVAGRLPEATNYLVRSLRSRPDWSGTHQNLGLALFKLGDYSGALTHLAEAVRLDSNAPVSFTALADDLSARGESDEAVRYYLTALRFNPADADAHYHLGLEWLQHGRIDEAIGQFQEVIRLRPDDAEARNDLARALEMKNTPAAR